MFRLFARPLLACCGVFALLVNAAVAADHRDDINEPRGALTLGDAIAAALQRNPELRSADFDIRAADARRQQAGQRPRPEVGIEFENFAGSGRVRGTDALETTLTLSQVIELGDKRRRRIDVAGLGRDSAALQREARQLDVLAEVTRRFIDVAVAQQQLELSRAAATLSETTLRAIERRVAAARTPEAERSRAAIALGRARLEERQLMQSLRSAQRRLAASWGSSEPRFTDVRADLFDLPAVADLDTLLRKLEANPEFLRFANEQRLRDAEWQLAKAEARGDVTVGGGLRRFEETGDTGLVLSVSMPLGSRNQGAIREAALRREQVDVDRQAAFIDAQSLLYGFYQSLQQARIEVETLRTQLIPQAEAALGQTRYGYERGRLSYVELAAAQQELIALRREAITAAATYHRLLAEIERLANEPLARTHF